MRLFAALVLLMLLGTARAQEYDALLRVVDHGRYGFIDHRGAFAIPAQYYWASDFEVGFAEAYVCGHLVRLDPKGRLRALVGAVPGRVEPTRVPRQDQHHRLGRAGGC